MEALLEELRKKTESANAAKTRADNLRQQLMEYQENEEFEDEDEVVEPTPQAETPVSRSDIGSIVAEILQKNGENY